MKYLVFIYLFTAIPFISFAQTERLSPEKLWQLERLSDEQVSPNGALVLYGITKYELEANAGERDLYVQPIDGGEAVNITDNLSSSAGNARWRPDGKKIGFLCSRSGRSQLWEVNPDGTDLKQVTDFDYSIANFAYAPTQGYISFTSEVTLDETLNDKYPDLPQADARLIDDLMYRHWDSWHNYSYSHLFFVPYQDGKITGEAIDIMKGEKYDVPLQPFGGANHIVWSPDARHLLYVCKKSEGKEYATSTNSDLYLYRLSSGETINLTEGMSGYDTDPVFSPDGSKIAWLSMERPGFEADRNVVYLYNMATGNKKALSENFDASASSLVWGKEGKSLFFIVGKEATYQVYKMKLKSTDFDKINVKANDIEQLTQGWHNYYSLAFAGDQLLGSKASMSMPTQLFLIDPKTGKETQFTAANQEMLNRLNLGKVKKRMVETSDGFEMLVWVIYPPDFDPAKKYPALLYCQGGPQSAVSQFFSYRWNFQLMAANDYIIVAPNRRGLPGFGQAWNDEISGDWGGQSIKDYLSAIDDVAKEPYVDQERLGAVGASYGGYSVYFLAGMHEGRFKTFISHCGVFNLESWYGSTEEMFFANWDLGGAYWLRPEPASYEKFSPHKFVQDWDTPILVIHGQKDFRVPVSQGMEAFSAAQLQDIPSKFLYFPGEGHWVLTPQNGVLWHRVFFDWLDDYLK